MSRSSLFASGVARSSAFAVTVNGQPEDCFAVATGAFCLPRWDGVAEIALRHADGWNGARVCPAEAARVMKHEGDQLVLEAEGPQPFLVERPAGAIMAYILGASPESPAPLQPQGGRLLHFASGMVHEAGEIRLNDGDVLWIDEGAWVRGHVVASEASDVIIGGRGVLDGSWGPPDGQPTRPVLLDHCRHVSVSGLTMVNPRHWMLTIGGCEDVDVTGINQIGDGASTDGIDIVGSRRVRVTGCFLRNGDDNIALKALDVRKLASSCQQSAGTFVGDWTGPVEDILVEGCRLYNDRGGTAMEVGYETRTDHIRRITFRNIDVMAVHQFGSVFGIHNGDRATVEQVLWEDIRVAHHYDKLVDLRVLKSRWNFDPQPGRIHDITLRRIRVENSIYNPGYTVSLIGGHDADHPAGPVTFDDFVLGDRKVSCADDLSLFTRHADDVRFL